MFERLSTKGLPFPVAIEDAVVTQELAELVEVSDAYAVDQWATDIVLTGGLTYAYKGGVVFSGGVFSKVADATVTLVANTVNHVERDANGVVSVNQVGFTNNLLPMAKVTTDVSGITALEDWRVLETPASATVGSHVVATTVALGPNHTVSALSSGMVLRATGPTASAYGFLVASDIPGLDASKITTGTIASARLSGVYSGITGLGVQAQALDMGAQNITNAGTGTFSGAVSTGALTATTGTFSDTLYNSKRIEAEFDSGFAVVVGVGSPRATWTYNGSSGRSRLTGSVNISVSLGSHNVDDRLLLRTDGSVLIGTTTAATGAPRLDVVKSGSGALALALSSGTTNNSIKIGFVSCRHYTNAEQNATIIGCRIDVSTSVVMIGGGRSELNASTTIDFYTAANTTTLTGTLAADITGVGASNIFHTRGGITVDGNVLIGNTTAATGNPRLDVIGGAPALVIASTTTNATAKSGHFAIRHYTNAEQAFQVIGGFNDASTTRVFIGGGQSAQNAATQIEFYTAANNITLAGTLAADITGVGTSSLFHARGSMQIDTGLQLGSPTGGDKGAGTINVATDIYKNDSAYTNPDFVFAYAFAGKLENAPLGWKLRSLREVKAYAETWHHLPGVHRDRAMGMFDRSDWIAEKMEEVHLHLFGHEDRLDQLEADKQRLKDECTTLRAQVVELQLAV